MHTGGKETLLTSYLKEFCSGCGSFEEAAGTSSCKQTNAIRSDKRSSPAPLAPLCSRCPFVIWVWQFLFPPSPFRSALSIAQISVIPTERIGLSVTLHRHKTVQERGAICKIMLISLVHLCLRLRVPRYRSPVEYCAQHAYTHTFAKFLSLFPAAVHPASNI